MNTLNRFIFQRWNTDGRNINTDWPQEQIKRYAVETSDRYMTIQISFSAFPVKFLCSCFCVWNFEIIWQLLFYPKVCYFLICSYWFHSLYYVYKKSLLSSLFFIITSIAIARPLSTAPPKLSQLLALSYHFRYSLSRYLRRFLREFSKLIQSRKFMISAHRFGITKSHKAVTRSNEANSCIFVHPFQEP